MPYTQNYQLNQWKKSDRIMMEDFNSDNAKIDAALAALNAAKAENTALANLSQQISSLTATVEGNRTALAGKGNCEIRKIVYTGTGLYGASNPSVWTFGDCIPQLVIIAHSNNSDILLCLVNGITSSKLIGLSLWATAIWSGNTLSLYAEHPRPQMKESNVVYHMVVLLLKD